MHSMDCTDIKALLSGLIDDEVDAETRYTAERHLADCADCRTLIDEHEALNGAIVADVASLLAPRSADDYAAELTGAVLSRTIYAADRRRSGWFVNSLGWLAAAACLALAATIWFFEQDQNSPYAPAPITQGNDAAQSPMTATTVRPTSLRSWTYDGALTADQLGLETQKNSDSASAKVPVRDAAHVPSTLTRDDEQVLDAATLLMRMLLVSSDESFVEVERIRQIATYDEILPRLTRTHSRLALTDRAPVMAAESVLMRIVNGGLSLDDLRQLRELVQQSELAAQLAAITQATTPAHAL